MLFPVVLAVSGLCLTAAWSSPSQAPLFESVALDNGPHVDHARENAPHIFNALHSAMRQWGSSLKHNGMSFFTASIPNNTLLYHGTHTKDRINGTEWLAFEIEHAEVFAGMRGPGGGRRGRPPPGGPGGGPGGRPGEGKPPVGPPGEGPGYPGRPDHPPKQGLPNRPMHKTDDESKSYGYLHTYRTSRPLTKLLYLDGMSAGKTSMGTVDTQDYVMRNDSEEIVSAPWGDYQRAQAMCALGKEYEIEGIIRMEAGFELILCDFSSGLDFVGASQRPGYSVPESYQDLSQFEYFRGVSMRFQGITAGRVKVDYSNMVSAYFYPLNLTNPNPSRSELPRLPMSDKKGLARVRSDVLSRFSKSGNDDTVDWQGLVDMVVTRYSDRLQFLVSNNLTERALLSEINFLLNAFIDYADPRVPAAIETCASVYLTPVTPQTESDFLIYEAIITVTRKICSTLFEVRKILLDGEIETYNKVGPNPAIQELIEYLDWSTWLECGKCGYDEVCFVAIWPWGSVEDHTAPGCRKSDDMAGRNGYWDFGS